MFSAIINNEILFEMTNREKAKKLFEESLKKHDTHIYMVKPIHCTSAIDAIEQALSIDNVVGQSEQLVCDDCGYEINPAGICINMNCSTNENP